MLRVLFMQREGGRASRFCSCREEGHNDESMRWRCWRGLGVVRVVEGGYTWAGHESEGYLGVPEGGGKR